MPGSGITRFSQFQVFVGRVGGDPTGNAARLLQVAASIGGKDETVDSFEAGLCPSPPVDAESIVDSVADYLAGWLGSSCWPARSVLAL